MDSIEELDSMLSRCGSFWYGTLSEEDRQIARTIAQTACRSRVNRQLQAAFNLVKGGGYYRDNFRVIRFKPSDVDWVGTKAALQKRVIDDKKVVKRGVELNLGPGIWLTPDKTGTQRIAADEHSTPVLFPRATESDVVFPGNFRVQFCLTVDPDIMIESIKDETGRDMMQGEDFLSFFGTVWFRENPLKLFPNMTLTTKSVVVRARNILCYTLQLDDVYGPVDRVMEYYKGHQSVEKFYLAAAQACGLAVVRGGGRIRRIDPLLGGYAYTLDDDSRYDAPYRHSMLPIGRELKDKYVIGGAELFSIAGPGDELPAGVPSSFNLDLGNVLPIPGLLAPNAEGTVYVTYNANKYCRPAFKAPTSNPSALSQYYAILAEHDGGPSTTTGTTPVAAKKMNLVSYVRNTLLKNRCIVVCINEAYMRRSMRLKLDSFIRREVPMGAVLTYAPITSTITA